MTPNAASSVPVLRRCSCTWKDVCGVLKAFCHWALLQSPLLQALSQFRFVGHAFAPALTFVAAEMASRGGVTWATGPAFEGTPVPIMTVIAITILMIIVRFQSGD
jgi:hypothetical protein